MTYQQKITLTVRQSFIFCITQKETTTMNQKRECGVLLPISSLPSKYGIGCFSKSAYDFVDALKEAGQSCWQILPLGPTSYGDSPYQSFSTFAGNPYFISLEDLIEEGVLTKRMRQRRFWKKQNKHRLCQNL